MAVNLRKGFYFSFDAFLAVTVMAASLAVVAQSSMVSSDTFQVSSINYKNVGVAGQDAMRLASHETFETFKTSFKNDLLGDDVAMDEEDLERTLLDGITFLWASGNYSSAGEAAEKYFDSKIPDKYGYKLQVNENGSSKVLYRTNEMPENPEVVRTVSRLVSGHRVNRSSEGFQARARASSITKNNTKIVSLPPLGSANEKGKMEVEKTFWLNNTEKIHNATFYLSIQYNGNTHFEQFRINGDHNYGESKFDWIHDDGTASYGRLDITDEVETGKNEIYIRMKSNSFHSHFHPGTKLEIEYRQDINRVNAKKTRHKEIYLEDIYSENSGSQDSGVFQTQPFDIPENADFINATYKLTADGFKPECGYSLWGFEFYDWDVRSVLNGEDLIKSCADGKYTQSVELSESQVQNGTNVITTYLNLYNNDFWGGDSTHLVSRYGNESTSHIDLWYNVSSESLRFGEIRVTDSEQIGGLPEDPKFYDKSFEYRDLASTRFYIAQRYSIEPGVKIDDGTEEVVFQSSGSRSAPTRIYASPEFFSTNSENTVTFEDSAGDYEFFPESSFEWTLWAPSQVGYGQLFSNRSSAVDDARERLNDKLGDLIGAENIETGTVSTGNQPFLWGPASVKLVIWRE